jgi:glycosyltransferase involved in cell wall biosynthesis
MSQPFFSIIIPVYQTEPFLEECLLSLREQTFMDFECIVINDGSIGSGIDSNDKNSEFWSRADFENQILPNGVEKTKQAKYIFDRTVGTDIRFTFNTQENQGLSATKNNGLNLVKGSRLVILDSDDFVEKDYLYKAYKRIAENPRKIIYGEVKNLINDKVVDFNNGQKFFLTDNNLANILVAPTFTCTPVNYFWDLSLLKSNNIYYDKNVPGEDTKFMLDNLFVALQNGYANEFVATNGYYIYRQFDGQATREDSFQIRLFDETTHYINVRIKDFAKLGLGYSILSRLFVARYKLFGERLKNKDESWNKFYQYYPKLLTAVSVFIAKITK